MKALAVEYLIRTNRKPTECFDQSVRLLRQLVALLLFLLPGDNIIMRDKYCTDLKKKGLLRGEVAVRPDWSVLRAVGVCAWSLHWAGFP